ncbi:MAG: hypothetical protein ABIO55_06570 [Ginsengibacter sp.]
MRDPIFKSHPSHKSYKSWFRQKAHGGEIKVETKEGEGANLLFNCHSSALGLMGWMGFREKLFLNPTQPP